MPRLTIAEAVAGRVVDEGDLEADGSVTVFLGCGGALGARVVRERDQGAVLSPTRVMSADHLRAGVRVNFVIPARRTHPVGRTILDKPDDPEAERRALDSWQPHGPLV